MTPNRARKTDTAKLLAGENIPHREAAYKTSNRTLRLPSGSIYDFTAGPVRYLGRRGSGISAMLNAVTKEAKAKGWGIVWLNEIAPERAQDLASLPKAPALIIAFSDHPLGHAPVELFEQLEKGQYEGLNVIIVREPRHADYQQKPPNGRAIHVGDPDARQPKQRLDNVELAKARIAFALRFADMHATGADDVTALGAVAHDLERFGTPEAAAIAAAARSAFDPVRNGYTVAGHFKAKHEELFGTHLVEVIDSAWHAGRLAAGLRDAAATIEADLRIGLIA